MQPAISFHQPIHMPIYFTNPYYFTTYSLTISPKPPNFTIYPYYFTIISLIVTPNLPYLSTAGPIYLTTSGIITYLISPRPLISMSKEPQPTYFLNFTAYSCVLRPCRPFFSLFSRCFFLIVRVSSILFAADSLLERLVLLFLSLFSRLFF